MTKLEQLAEGRRLRDIESEKLIVVEMAREHGVQAPPSAAGANCCEEQPAVAFRKLRDRKQQPDGQERTRIGMEFPARQDGTTLGEHAHVVCRLGAGSMIFTMTASRSQASLHGSSHTTSLEFNAKSASNRLRIRNCPRGLSFTSSVYNGE